MFKTVRVTAPRILSGVNFMPSTGSLVLNTKYFQLRATMMR